VRADLEADPDTLGLHAWLRELDPVAADRMEPGNRRRIVRALEVVLGSGRRFSDHGPGVDSYPPTPVTLLGLRLPTTTVAERIEARYHRQMTDGFLDEVRRLADGPALSHTAAQALGYRELLAHVRGGPGSPTLDEALDEAIRRTRGFARRQRSWFGRDPRITWFDVEDPADAVAPVAAAASEAWSRPEGGRTSG
jgi:tRNA dimethylallyltransferase